MFAFRKHSSPTVSQLLRLSRSPVTFTILGAPQGAHGQGAPVASTEAVVDLLHGVIDQLERSGARLLPKHGQYRRVADGAPGMGAHAGAFALGVAAALLAAGLFGVRKGSSPALQRAG